MHFIKLLLLGTFFHIINAQNGKQLKTISEWKYMDFIFPTPQDREIALQNEKFVMGNSVLLDVDVDYRGVDQGRSRVFVTMPRFQKGVPVTLGVMSQLAGEGGLLIDPYPSYAWQSNPETNCNGIVSVFRITIDECRRLWVLDTGKQGDVQFCPPQILAFDLTTDKLIHRYQIPKSNLACDISLLITPMVDVRDPNGSCRDTMVYMADVTGFAIIVYDMLKQKSWRITNKFMFPNPDHASISVAGESFELMDGVLALALSPPQINNNVNYGSPFGSTKNVDRTLYFHSLAARSENSVQLSVLNNSTIWEENSAAESDKFTLIGRRPEQCAGHAMDRNGNLFFGLLSSLAIGCWDSSRPYTPQNINIVAQNRQTLQFPSGVKVILNKKGYEELWVLSNRFQKLMAGTMKTDEVNFRIMAVQINDLLGGKICKPTPSGFGFPI